MPTSTTPLPPPGGQKITCDATGRPVVPDHPVLPFIEGDGTGPDIWRASVRVFDAAVAKAYGGKRKIAWLEVLAGEKAFQQTGSWLPDETLATFREYLVGIKGPLTTPIGGGIRSLNVALRQILDLYVCLRPVRWFEGVPSPVKHPERVDMVIFRENTEDIYAGLEWPAGPAEVKKIIEFVKREFPKEYGKIRFPRAWDWPLPVSREGTERLVRSAPIRHRARPRARRAGTRQHHEVHRGRSRLGLRTRSASTRGRSAGTTARLAPAGQVLVKDSTQTSRCAGGRGPKSST